MDNTKDRPLIVGLGNALVDVLAKVDAHEVGRHELKPGGMHLVDADAAEALYREVGPGLMQSGGSVANTTAHLAGEEVSAAFIGKVAADELGDAFAAEFEALSIGFATSRTSDMATGRCVVLVTPDGERTMSTYLGAAQSLAPADVEAAMPPNADMLIIEGYLWDSPEGAQTIATAVRLARQAGAMVAMTPSDSLCVERNHAAMSSFLDNDCDVLVGNEDEIRTLAGDEKDTKSALDWARDRVGTVVLTMSAAGAYVARGEDVIHVPADPVAEVVDTTGAGDAYAAGLLAGLARGHDPARAARRGATLAARVIGHTGARQGAATLEPSNGQSTFLDNIYSVERGDTMRRYYDDWAKSYDADLEDNDYRTPARCAEALAAHLNDPAAPILDFACGTGISGVALHDAGFTSVDGTDISDGMLRQARAKGVYRDLWAGDPDKPLDVRHRGYAAITAVGAIGAGAAPAENIEGAIDSLAPGGLFVVSLNDHTLEDAGFKGHLMRAADAGHIEILHDEHGPHLPALDLGARVFVVRKL